MSVMDKEAYEERYGEKVIYCRVHQLSGIDSCIACEEEERGEEEMVTVCATCDYKSSEDEFISVGNPNVMCPSCYDSYLKEADRMKAQEERQTERLVYAINTDYLD